MDPLKTCSKCREAKPHAEFHRNKARHGGLQARCKSCDKAYLAERRAADPALSRTYAQKHYAASPEKHRERSARWYAANPEKVKAIAAKRTAEEIKRAHRYLRAFGYFQGRQGWTDTLSRCLLAEKRLNSMCFMRPALEAHLAELV